MKTIVIKDINDGVIFSHERESNSIRYTVKAAIDDKTNLSRVYFESQNLTGVDFSGQDLSNSVFKRCNLNGANFKDCIISATSFISCDSVGARGFYSERYNSYMCADDSVITFKEILGIDGSVKSSVVEEDKSGNSYSFVCN